MQILIILPITIILAALWAIKGKKIYGKILGYFWLGLLVLYVLGIIVNSLTAKKELKKKDYYGQYVVDRSYFKGKQADWQYDNFRFEIKENDSIYFYLTHKAKILKTFRGIITTTQPYGSERLIVNMELPTYHIVISNPTIYRSAWGFHLVFNSPKFNNVYFKKDIGSLLNNKH